MPSPEHGASQGGADEDPSREHEPRPYYRAARFAGERPAGRAYAAVQDAIFRHPADLDLSAYRFQLSRRYHVAVLGQPPPEAVDQHLQALLAAGEPTELPAEVLKLLSERRAQAIKEGPWTEGHYRPGTPL